MYKLIIPLLSFCLLYACSKDLQQQEICIDDVCIDGHWNWLESYGSIAGITITPETENETKKLIIDENSFQGFVNDSMTVYTGYEYVKTDELETFTNDSLVLKLESGQWYAVFREANKLILFEPCADCWQHTFELD